MFLHAFIWIFEASSPMCTLNTTTQSFLITASYFYYGTPGIGHKKSGKQLLRAWVSTQRVWPCIYNTLVTPHLLPRWTLRPIF